MSNCGISNGDKPRFRQARHRCNGCKAIFDCAPCHHGYSAAVFCSPECEANAAKAETPVPAQGTRSVYQRYLKRAGLK